MAASSTLNLSLIPPFSAKIQFPPSLHIKSTLNPTDQIQINFPAIPQINNLRIVFSSGGTGGHIYPALSISDELKNINPNTEILFLGSKNGMEKTLISSQGYNFAEIEAFPLIRPLISLRNVLIPFYLVKSMYNCWKLLRDFAPDIVVGTGGYVSFPVCFTAGMLRDVKMVIQEQNSVPGIANWALSYLADVIFVAFKESVKFFPKGKKCVVSGNPVRLSMRRYVSKAVARLNYFPNARKKSLNEELRIVLILGGSLGAQAINIALLHMYNQMFLEHENWYIIWQTGVKRFDEMDSLVKHHPRLVLTPFLHKVELAYAAADLVVSRAGAMTCSEILATGKPSILIPSPNVAEGHQMKNASVMSELAGSKVITEDELDSTTLKIAIEDILGNETQMADMSKKAMKVAQPEASLEIAQHIMSLAKSR
ncbi:undecaprenyldiphospho-muramoylpentapeptide beta-Nacetylglucosaminyltransferase [Ranunculus cassubicifolius]